MLKEYLQLFIITLFLITLVKILVSRLKRKDYELPGPIRLPIIGNLLHIALIDWKRVWVALDVLSEKYGKIMGLYFGSRYVVVISCPHLGQELLSKDEWNGRPQDTMAKDKAKGKSILGLIFTQGDLWKETRKFTLKHLRDQGLGKSNMEKGINEEIEILEEFIEEKMNGNKKIILNFENIFGFPVINTIWRMVSGIRYEIEDHKAKVSQEMISNIIRKRPIGSGIFWSFPSLRKYFPKESGLEAQLTGYGFLKKTIGAIIKDHKIKKDKNDDFIDAYLEKMSSEPYNKLYFEEQLAVTCMDIFVAGSDTMSSTLKFAILLLILRPEIQEKIYSEINSFVDKGQRITLANKDELIYTKAVINEIYRFSSIAPIYAPHSTTEEISYKNFRIPKNSIVFINSWSFHHSKKWGDPHNFRPERFIDLNGNFISESNDVFPFGFGKRRCPGENLARATVFLTLINLIKKFQFGIIAPQKTPSVDPIVGLNLTPKPFSAMVTRRECK